MPQPLSVTQALLLAKGSLEQISATIVGEISEFSDKAGYKAIYFTIRDNSSALPCLVWRNVFQRAGVEIRQGMLVEVSGVFSLYAAKGRMNFDVKSLRLAGEGDLRLKVAQLAAKLEREGLMDADKKRAVPEFPSAIAVVTSPRGKAIHDILRTLRRRYPLAEILLVGVPVEGAGAVESIIDGLRVAQASSAQVMILARGGGSYEDLMPFNDERLARAIAAMSIPLVTGIGHEPDNTIADMVADHRASTPTAAAEYVVPDIQELKGKLDSYALALPRALQAKLDRQDLMYGYLRNRPIFLDDTQVIAPFSLMLEGAAQRLQQQLPNKLERDCVFLETMRRRLQVLGSNLMRDAESAKALFATRLDALSPLGILGRGYSIAYDQDGHVVDSLVKVDLGQQLTIRLVDGTVDCCVTDKQERTMVVKSTEEDHE